MGIGDFIEKIIRAIYGLNDDDKHGNPSFEYHNDEIVYVTALYELKYEIPLLVYFKRKIFCNGVSSEEDKGRWTRRL